MEVRDLRNRGSRTGMRIPVLPKITKKIKKSKRMKMLRWRTTRNLRLKMMSSKRRKGLKRNRRMRFQPSKGFLKRKRNSA